MDHEARTLYAAARHAGAIMCVRFGIRAGKIHAEVRAPSRCEIKDPVIHLGIGRSTPR